jgi:tRNA dimethylallyltransferase
MEAQATIPVICGPTASGKSAVAMWLSLRRELLVISADSRQIYRRFDIGTAKPAKAELARVPHRGVDVVDPTERYSAAEWVTMAQRAIRDAYAEGRLPIVVGGTGFYIGALFKPLFAEPPLDAERRQRLQRALGAMDLEELRRWCSALDPARAHLGRAQLLRAVELALLTGERLSELHASNARSSVYRPCYLLVDPGTELQGRIAARAAAMLDAGWPQEVQSLMLTVREDAPAWNATGYGVVRDLVRGEIDREGALERIVVETRQYAKRQRTWFRHQLARDSVQHLHFGQTGWQEKVNSWITEVVSRMRSQPVARNGST